MSVTLKLANDDAKLVGEALELLADLMDETGEKGGWWPKWCGHQVRKRLVSLAAAFETVVKADAKQDRFIYRVPIKEALGWELYKECLRWKLVDMGGEHDDCPKAIWESAWTAKVEVDGKDFVVTVDRGEPV